MKLFLLSLFLFSSLFAKERPLVVIVPSYNNLDYFEVNLTALFSQNYSRFRVIYIDDQSTDGTGVAVEEFLQQHGIDWRALSFDPSFSKDHREVAAHFSKLINEERHQCTVVHNSHRSGALANLYRAIHSCQDHEIAVLLDGDDCFYDDDVLKEVNEAYASGEVWFTHGTLIESPSGMISWCEPVPPENIERNAFREFKCPSHLRTFYVWLFKKIRLEDLLFHGSFFPMTWDMAIMYPIAEMAGKRHLFIDRVNYIYNMANPLNDNRVNADLQNHLDDLIKRMPRYQPLKEAPLLHDD